MREHYIRIRGRRGHVIAITHVANKMIRITWHAGWLADRTAYSNRNGQRYTGNATRAALPEKA